MGKKLTREIDFQVSGLHIREAEGEEKSRTVEGHAVVFGVRSINLVPWSSYREIYEVMEPGCITNELLKSSDVVLTAFHDNTIILGRCRQGKGTLSLVLEERGLKISCTLAETAKADELLSAIERGDISGMSFAYTADEEDTEKGVSYEKLAERTADGKEIWLRHVKKVNGLYDVTIAGHPAYPQTDVAQREVNEFFDGKIGKFETDEERQQREDEAAREKALMREREKSAAQRRLRERDLEDSLY